MDRTRTLDRALSRSGAGSRTQARAWIEAGRVRVNGRVVKDPGKWIDPSSDRITLDGDDVRAAQRVYLALHKPKGYLTTRSDPQGRATVYDLLGELPAWVAPVGRLDRDTSGLLLFTNDSDLADRITEPEHHLPKTYVVATRREVEDEALERLAKGLELDDGPTRPAKVRRLEPDGRRARIELVLREGRNRQVRRMLEAVGHKVVALERIAIGPVRLGGLAPGQFRPLTRAELAGLHGESVSDRPRFGQGGSRAGSATGRIEERRGARGAERGEREERVKKQKRLPRPTPRRARNAATKRAR